MEIKQLFKSNFLGLLKENGIDSMTFCGRVAVRFGNEYKEVESVSHSAKNRDYMIKFKGETSIPLSSVKHEQEQTKESNRLRNEALNFGSKMISQAVIY